MKTFTTIQALRGIAALLVVNNHLLEAWHDRVGSGGASTLWPNGQSGVDLFFVISGFVMVVSSHGLIDRSDGWRGFIARRLLRVAPPYWVFTTIKILAVLAVPSMVLGTRLDFTAVVCSYLLIPFDGGMRPILPVGWTLVLEMGFYVLFSASLFWRVAAVKFILPILCVLAFIGILRGGNIYAWPSVAAYCNPIILEFGAGVLIGTATLKGARLQWQMAAILVIAGFAAIAVLPMAGVLRPVTWGLPASAVVFGLVMLEPLVARSMPRWSQWLGDASYSIYLAHGFIVPPVVVLAGKLFGSGVLSLWGGILAGVPLSIAIGYLGMIAVERPLKRLSRPGLLPLRGRRVIYQKPEASDLFESPLPLGRVLKSGL